MSVQLRECTKAHEYGGELLPIHFLLVLGKARAHVDYAVLVSDSGSACALGRACAQVRTMHVYAEFAPSLVSDCSALLLSAAANLRLTNLSRPFLDAMQVRVNY